MELRMIFRRATVLAAAAVAVFAAGIYGGYITWETRRTGFFVLACASLLALGGLLASVLFLRAQLGAIHDEGRRRVEALAATDGLTGLLNRRSVLLRAEQELQRAWRHGAPLSLVLFDIDHFRRINETYGYPTGDGVLRDLTKLLRRGIRGYDVAGRYGGEEFLLVAPDTGPEPARLLAARIAVGVRKSPELQSERGDRITLSVSAGVASLRAEDKSIHDLVRRAESALEKAKSGGGDRLESDTPNG